MCGIIGVFERNSQPDERAFRAGLKTLSKRGPDKEGISFFPQAILGHRRLSIRDVSDNGSQPMSTPGGDKFIVYNGELYNDNQIRQSISPQPNWVSTSDTEVLLHAFSKFGHTICNKLNGMFAFAVYDKAKNQVTLARDHFGKKPLYYYYDSNCFAFASELKGILPIIRKHTELSINTDCIPKYLIYGYIPGESSGIEGVKRLAPSTVLTFDLQKWKIRHNDSYWEPQNICLNRTISYDDAIEQSTELIESAIRSRLVSDVPVSVFLSGGVDSSVVAAYAGKHASGMQAHSIVYPDSPSVDENCYAKQVAEDVGLSYNAHPFENKDVATTFSSLLNYMDEPFADGALIPLHFLSLQTSCNAPVALTGDGGDELFGGYVKYRAQMWAERIPYCMRNYASFLGSRMQSCQLSRLLTTLPYPFFARQYLWGSGSPLPHTLKNWIPDADWSPDGIFSDVSKYDVKWKQSDSINRSLFLDWRILLPDGYLFKSDRASMAASLEMRSPLLDKDLAEFALTLPGSLKLRGGYKSVLKNIAVRHVSRNCAYRRKRGFGVPLARWLRKELRDQIESLLLDTETPFFSKAEILKTWREHQALESNHSFSLFRIALFNNFYNTLKLKYMDNYD